MGQSPTDLRFKLFLEGRARIVIYLLAQPGHFGRIVEVAQHCARDAARLDRVRVDQWRCVHVAGDVQPAREILSGVLADPATPPPLAGQAREMLAEIELSERREEQEIGRASCRERV